jgi:glycosyltransferase involved in cell wall biosynthesis
VPGSDTSSSVSIAYLGDANSVHLRRWAGWFAARGHRVTLLVSNRAVVEPGLPAGVEVERFELGMAYRIRPVRSLASRRQLREVLARIGPDVLHAHYVTVNGWRAWLSGFHPYAVTVWGSDLLVTARSSRKAGLVARLALRNADLVTGGSQTLVRAAIEFGARPERTHLIHHGVEVDRFSPGDAPAALRGRLGLTGRRVIFSPRAIKPLYHQRTVLEALAGLPPDVALLMTRQLADPAELAALEGRAAELGLTDRLIAVPRVEEHELPDLYRLADVVVSVPSSDGGPTTLVEALASGRPVVASDLPAVREWLDELGPGTLVPVGDVEATSRAIRLVLERGPEERERRARVGRQAVLERADRNRTMGQMEALYLELARKGREGRSR